jgi:hypothetical protein
MRIQRYADSTCNCEAVGHAISNDSDTLEREVPVGERHQESRESVPCTPSLACSHPTAEDDRACSRCLPVPAPRLGVLLARPSSLPLSVSCGFARLLLSPWVSPLASASLSLCRPLCLPPALTRLSPASCCFPLKHAHREGLGERERQRG